MKTYNILSIVILCCIKLKDISSCYIWTGKLERHKETLHYQHKTPPPRINNYLKNEDYSSCEGKKHKT